MVITQRIAIIVAVATTCFASLAAQNAHAQGSCCSSSSSSGTSAGASCHAEASPAASPGVEAAWSAPHGGQVFKTMWNYYEVVYGPQETRVHVYDIFRNPVTTGGIRGWARMRVRSNGSEYRYPLQVPAGSHDYLAMQVDLTRVRDGDMDVQFDLENLPNSEQPTVRFVQAFAMQTPARNAPAYPSDQTMTDQTMANMQQSASHASMSHAGMNDGSANHAGHTHQNDQQNTSKASSNVAVTTATSVDSRAIQLQRVCPITGSQLGEHGAPLKVSVNGRSLYVCCQGCVDTVLEDPETYLK